MCIWERTKNKGDISIDNAVNSIDCVYVFIFFLSLYTCTCIIINLMNFKILDLD